MDENKLSNEKKILILVIVLFALIVALSVVNYLSSVKKSSPIVVWPTVTPTPTSIINASDWKTYTNEKYGFEIKYSPEKWKECMIKSELSASDTLFLLTRTNQKCYPAAESGLSDLITISLMTDIYDRYNNYEALKSALEQALNREDKTFEVEGGHYSGYYSVEQINESMIGGLKSLTVETADLAYGIPSTERYIFNNKNLFNISSLMVHKEFNKEIDQVLSTFRLLK